MRKKTLVLGLFTVASSITWAQSSQINFDHLKEFKQAKYLYLTEVYKASQDKFEKVLDRKDVSPNTREEAEFYASLVNLVNNEQGAEERFLAFEKKYPRSIYMQNAHWELGSFYLTNGAYKKAYEYLSKGDLYDLPERKRNEYQFKLGYAAFMNDKTDEALRYLEPLVQSEQYQDAAAYYTGHIYYARKNFEKAFNYFDTLKVRNPEYEPRVLPYVVQIEFNNKEYDKVIADGRQLLESNNDPFIQSEVSKIVGESYFQRRKYDEAIPYLENYQGKKSNADYYQLGYAHYQKGEFETAISLLNKIIEEENALAQTAYYQLGNAYLQTNQKQQALTAYKSASEMSFDTTIQEDAFYNYAKLSYEIGNPFLGAPQVLQSFEQVFPNSKYLAEINNYLIDAYISSGNYKNALEVLAAINPKNQIQSNAEQEAAFLYGVNLVKDGDINQAADYFSLASKTGNSEEIKTRSIFWLGESNYRQNKYQEALQYFNQFDQSRLNLPEKKEVKYQLGYTHLKLRQYTQAIQNFETYLASNPPGNFKADARLRLADAYIGAQQTQKALTIYRDLAAQEPTVSDEAAYNSAVALGILGKQEDKIQSLENFLRDYPTSSYYHMAKFELALAYTQNGGTQQALKNLNDLIKNGNSEMAARANMQKGVIYNNQSNTENALVAYKSAAEGYPNTQLARDAIDNVKRIYLENNNVNAFESWANSLGYYQVDQAELELLAYASANEAFDEKDYTKAINLFNSFNQKYPTSTYSAATNYRLGESYYQLGDYDKAEEPLTKAALSKNEYQEDALLRLSQLYINQNRETEALLTLENLNQVTNNASYKTFTEVHLMRLYSKRNQHNKAVNMAENVLSNAKNEPTVIQEAELTKARSLYASNQLDQARVAFEKLENSGSNAIKAEALYYKAFFLNKEKNFKASNDTVFQLASNYAEQQYWGSKALVIMAHNYYKLGDLYQANTTLDAVINNYQDFPEVVNEAKKLKSEILSK
ncbi:tetratricopeptide repeat protein [Flavobacteriaceae bacterium Ap0902]|nr:tetratricopeptide repeat protein [Flavobacteriaceae bacterium Ap0902]